MGTIMAVVAALLIHMDMKAVRTMNPNMMEDGEVPDNIRQAIFLKHPGDENEDDDDEEEVDMEQEEESREGDSFKNFIKNRTDLTVDKIKNQPQN